MTRVILVSNLGHTDWFQERSVGGKIRPEKSPSEPLVHKWLDFQEIRLNNFFGGTRFSEP